MDQGRGVLTNKQSSSAPTHVCHPPSSLYYLEGSHEFPLNWDTAPCRVGRFVRSRPNNIQAVLAAGSLTGRLPLSRQPLKRLFRRRNPQRVGPETYLASRILRLEVALGANSPAVQDQRRLTTTCSTTCFLCCPSPTCIWRRPTCACTRGACIPTVPFGVPRLRG